MKVIYKILFFLYLAAIATLCLIQFNPSEDLPREFFGIAMDKIIHFIMFAPFPFLFWKAFHKPTGNPYRLVGCILIALTLGMLLGGGLELLQGLVGRCTDIADFRADSIGLLSTCIAIMVYCAASKNW